jgi:tRNA(adenine34) deaminase
MEPSSRAGTFAAVPDPAAPTDDELMGLALAEARQAGDEGEVPVGAVIVIDGAVVARGRNRRQADADPTAHAELSALRAACADAGSWRLPGAHVVVTLEPCPMCAGALLAARVARVVFGAPDPKAGALGSLYNLGADPRLPHELEVRAGVRAEECGALLAQFFADRR